MPGPGASLIVPTALPLSTTLAAAAATAAGTAATDAAADAVMWGAELAELEISIAELVIKQGVVGAVNPAAGIAMGLQITGMQTQALRLAAHQLNAESAAAFYTAQGAYLTSLAVTYAALLGWATADTA